jgi:cell division protein FtsI/penicillin-binding protein 2
MNPKTGEILAMVSFPTYENNRMARLIPAYYYEQLIKDPAILYSTMRFAILFRLVRFLNCQLQ